MLAALYYFINTVLWWLILYSINTRIVVLNYDDDEIDGGSGSGSSGDNNIYNVYALIWMKVRSLWFFKIYLELI